MASPASNPSNAPTALKVAKDNFNEVVAQFLEKVAESNLVKIETFNYNPASVVPCGRVTDNGVFIVYKG